ncbi:MAG TPA: PspC domain-containing protein [Flavobacterium sp.]|nr:PspC domain-containing protein [Flavobacterium sp.]HPJ11083.1 PspC domain-containing protein [Flavobacterium sp.]
MNKTVNINLGGMFFHIDEDAYQKLTRYFDAIKRSLTNSNGKDEIIKDIEMRIAELVAEKHTSEKQVISLSELDEIIAVMGQPEDYRIDPDGDEPSTGATDFNTAANPTGRKKLYRDKEGGMIGGVLSGLSYYFGIDKVWLRVLLIILLWVYGVGFFTYIILWIVMPEAVTTTEKLEMMGEPVNISNIEKKVREEFDSLSENFKSGKVGAQVKSNADRIGSSFGDFILTCLKICAKFLGVILIMTSMAVLVMLFIGVFTLGTSAVIDFPWQDFFLAGSLSNYPLWMFGLLMFFTAGIPFFFLLLLGFKLLSPNMKSIGRIASFTLLALWLIAVGILASLGIQQATEFAVDGRMVQKETINLSPTDTLRIKFRHSEYFSKGVNDHRDFIVTEDSLDNRVIYSNQVHLRIVATDQKLPYLQIEREAKGKSLSAAKKTAEKIKYGYEIKGNELILDNYLLSDFKNKYRDQEVELTLYLPTGTYFKPDSSVQEYDYSDDEFFNLHYSGDYLYKVEGNKVKCLTCPADENEWNDVEGSINIDNDQDSTSTKITLNENGILIKKDKTEEVKEVKSVKINKDGITIKTE